MQLPFDSELYKLDSEQSAFYLKQPETGMGYQFLELKGNPKSDHPIVTNASFIIEFDGSSNIPVFRDFENLQLEFERIETPILKQFLIDAYEVKKNNKYIDIHNLKNSDRPPYLYITRQGDEFRRLSAFRNDKRITDNGSLVPGSYGTSITDLTVVPSGIAAVGRYALPNRIAACYVYQIIPEPGTPVYFGTVTPNYGLCGGGVEVYFPNGCNGGSLRLLKTIPEI